MGTIGFGQFVRARHALWLDKTYGIPAENFEDKEILDLLRPWHFTNIWRECDRGTLNVINDLQLPSLNSYLAVHRTLIYRFFNSYDGYNRYHEIVREPGNPTVEEINQILDQPGNFSGAYIRTIQRSVAVAALRSLAGHAEVISELLDAHKDLDDLDQINVSRMAIRSALGCIPSFGKFLADQLMLDFSWHANPWDLTGFKPSLGPGAKRGLDRLGYTFAQAKTEAEECLDLPRPRILVSMGDKAYSEVEVPITWVEVEHALCEYFKLIKLEEAVNEGLGRQVKMRRYGAGDARSRTAKPKINPLPMVWAAPKF